MSLPPEFTTTLDRALSAIAYITGGLLLVGAVIAEALFGKSNDD